MFSNELMKYLNTKGNEEKKTPEVRESNSVTKPLLYIILKYNTSPKEA